MDKMDKILEELRDLEWEMNERGEGAVADRLMKIRWDLIH